MERKGALVLIPKLCMYYYHKHEYMRLDISPPKRRCSFCAPLCAVLCGTFAIAISTPFDNTGIQMKLSMRDQ